VAFSPHKGSRSHARRCDCAELVYVLMRAENKVKPSEDVKLKMQKQNAQLELL